MLALAFNEKAAAELREQIQSGLADILNIAQVQSSTFHSFGRSIIAKTKEAPNIDGDEIAVKIAQGYRQLYAEDFEFRAAAVLYMAVFTPTTRGITEFKTTDEYREYRRGGPIKCFASHTVASFEEQKIADWLYLQAENAASGRQFLSGLFPSQRNDVIHESSNFRRHVLGGVIDGKERPGLVRPVWEHLD